MGSKNLWYVKGLAYSAVIGLALAGGMKEAKAIDSNSIIQEDIEYYIQTDKSVYDLGEDVDVLYRVTNLSDEDVEYKFTYGPIDNTCDWMVDKDELRIWDNLGRGATTVLTSFNLGPSEFYEYTHTWNMTYKNGDNIFPGNHNVTGVLGYPPDHERYVPVSVPITITTDNLINFKDYAILANDWQKTGPGLERDINEDNVVDYNDLEILAKFWLRRILEDDTEDSYSCEGNFDPCYPCSNAVDEDWDTYALAAPNDTNNPTLSYSYIYEDYTIPSPGITKADFIIKYEQTAQVTPGLCTNVTEYWNGSTWTDVNCTALTNQISTLIVEIPDDALNGTTLQLKTRTWKGSGLIGGGNGMYYEGKVIWYEPFYRPTKITYDLDYEEPPEEFLGLEGDCEGAYLNFSIK